MAKSAKNESTISASHSNSSFENINIQISKLFVLLKNYGEKKPEY